MNLSELFKATVEELQRLQCKFAVAGGLAASLYREQSRTTFDADFLFLANGLEVKKGRELLEKLNLGVGEVKLHQLTRSPQMNKKSKETFILVGRKGKENPGVDLLLPPFPWFEKAINRAEANKFDFGFGKIPTVTPEDMILTKLYANRPKDVDDIISIFESGKELDLTYLAGEISRMQLTLPKDALQVAPKALKRFAKKPLTRKRSFP